MTATRLYAIVARDARRAVVFRRGPSGQVRLLLWHLDTDRFEGGQWFKGRIYERRCDLSPDGTKLIYFAADFSRPKPSWTAVSKPHAASDLATVVVPHVGTHHPTAEETALLAEIAAAL